MKLPRLLAWCAKRGFGGLEGMAGVPGSLGGAVAGNAGAQGMDMGSVLSRVTLFSPESGVRTLSRPEVTCTYRHFAPHTREISACSSAITLPCPAAYTDDWYVIIEVEMQLRKERPEVIMQTMRSLMARKMRVQPVRAWSAGCLFRNPEPAESSLPAGKLLDEAGFRGKRHGGVCLSPMHANFLVHEGNGSAKAALELIFEARETVHSRFGVLLRPEVKLWVC